MPIPANLLISDLYQGIVNKFGGRQNLGPASSPTALYVTPARDAIRDITENNEFEELKVPSPIVPIQRGVLQYSISQFIPSSPASAAAIWDITDVFDWGFWLNPGSTNGPFRILKQRRVPTVNQYQFGTTAPAPPIYFSRFGSPWGINGAGNELLVGPTPDNTYQSVMYFRARHPFTTTIFDSPIYIPDSWQEILEYSTCLRLAANEGSEKNAATFRSILFGDPKRPDIPGILKSRQMQMERDANHNERQISVATQLFSGHY